MPPWLTFLCGIAVVANGASPPRVRIWSGASPSRGDRGDNTTGRANGDQTDITLMLNKLIEPDPSKGVYAGGHGVLIRALNDGMSQVVVPASFLHNDINPPSTMYVDGDPMCPTLGNSGYNENPHCSDDPFSRANVGVVIGTELPSFFEDGHHIQDDGWNKGVFYGTDSNAADQRCIYIDEFKGYDCPGGWQTFNGTWIQNSEKKGAGNYEPGNPNAGGGGGGAGCHFSIDGHAIDQFDAYDGHGVNIVKNRACECNYTLGKTNWWQDWVKHWIAHAQHKKGFEWMGWFGKGKAPSFAVDIAACWVNNPRDMIMIQNAMWWFKDEWNNLLMPQSLIFDGGDPWSQRHYWGWNEVPVSRGRVSDPKYWDSVFIRLPPAICGNSGKDDTLSCLPAAAQERLESLLIWYEENQKLQIGAKHIKDRPGSYIILMRELYVGERKWHRQFYCEDWFSPSNKYEIVFKPMSATVKTGVCYIDYGRQPAPTPKPQPVPPGPPVGGEIRLNSLNPKKCIDLTGGDLTPGTRIQIWDCNGVRSAQNWVYLRGSLRSGVDTDKCIDLGNLEPGTPLAIETCKEGALQQQLVYQTNGSYQARGGNVCVDLTGGNYANGNILQVWTCDKGNPNQVWSAPTGPPPVQKRIVV